LKASYGIGLMQNGRARFYDAACFDICASVPFDCLDVADCRARTLRACRTGRLVAVATRKTRPRVDGHVRPNAELTGRRRVDARPGLQTMYRVPAGRAWWPAVGAPVERPVRHHLFFTPNNWSKSIDSSPMSCIPRDPRSRSVVKFACHTLPES
jgi:hypothetical protein